MKYVAKEITDYDSLHYALIEEIVILNDWRMSLIYTQPHTVTVLFCDK